MKIATSYKLTEALGGVEEVQSYYIAAPKIFPLYNDPLRGIINWKLTAHIGVKKKPKAQAEGGQGKVKGRVKTKNLRPLLMSINNVPGIIF